jgi:hypothetical protein
MIHLLLDFAERGRSAARDNRRTIPLDFIASPLHRLVLHLRNRPRRSVALSTPL